MDLTQGFMDSTSLRRINAALISLLFALPHAALSSAPASTAATPEPVVTDAEREEGARARQQSAEEDPLSVGKEPTKGLAREAPPDRPFERVQFADPRAEGSRTQHGVFSTTS